jgi:hypothetical protein
MSLHTTSTRIQRRCRYSYRKSLRYIPRNIYKIVITSYTRTADLQLAVVLNMSSMIHHTAIYSRVVSIRSSYRTDTAGCYNTGNSGPLNASFISQLNSLYQPCVLYLFKKKKIRSLCKTCVRCSRNQKKQLPNKLPAYILDPRW